MRTISISSSFAAVVDHVIRSVAVAGVAVRTLLQLTLKREYQGYWLNRCQPGCPCGRNLHGFHRFGHSMAGSPPAMAMTALAVCPAPTRLISVLPDRSR